MLASRDPSDISNIWPDWHEHQVNDGRRLDFIDAKAFANPCRAEDH
jgi:hypothetical protein